MYKSSPFLSNILICNNADNSGGTIYGYQSSPSLVNITIAHNTSYDKGGAIHLDGKNHFYIKNSIIWANEAASGSSLVFAKTTAADTISLEYTDIDTTADQWLYMENRSEISRQIFWGEGNLSQDPLFQDPQTNDFTLQLASPCIDAGDVADEVGDEPTPNGSRINLGAYGGTVQAAITIISSLTTTTSPMDYKLCQNYPNPFNPRTTIKYQLQMISEVELSVYNVLGQKVATLVSENQPAGEYNIEWDASGLASGMYYYRLTAGQFVETKRLVLLK